MGIEIEGFLEERTPVSYGSYQGFFYVTRDGSIDADNWNQLTVELVSMPLTPEWLKREIYKVYQKFPLMHNSSCGIHIHVSRKWLSEKKARAIYKFIQSLNDTDICDFFGRGPNTYCRTDESWGYSRYCAINNENKNTIEFRMFCSGDAKWAAYCVDCVKYMIDNAYQLNVDAFNAFIDMRKV
jgi:hypothetical protein